MNKPVLLSAVEYQMLVECAKRNRQKPEAYLVSLIHKVYGTTK